MKITARFALLFGLVVAALAVLTPHSVAQDDDDLVDLFSRQMDDRAVRWDCPTLVKEVCTSDGCESATPTITIKIDFEDSTYSRCDTRGCDTFSFLLPFPSGIFTIIEPAPGTFFKALSDGSEFVEVATAGLSVHTAHGRCIPR